MNGRPLNVLLIEDNPGDARLIREMLAEAKHTPFVLESAARLDAGLEHLAGREVDVVLMDLSLPDSHGLETLIRFHAQAPGVSVVVLTGLDDEELAVEALRKGAQDYLVKGQLNSHLLANGLRYAFERKRVEEENRNLEIQLRHSQRFEALGRLAGGIAHDFNNMLTIITGNAKLLLDELGPQGPRGQQIRMIKEAGERSAALARELLAFGRKQVLQPKVLDLNALLSSLDDILRRLIGEDIALKTNLDPGLRSIRADPVQLQQVLLNLAVNARDAMPGGGKLVLETKNVVLDESYASQHVGVQPGAYVRLSASDSGCGMDAETQARIFEPFFTTKGKEKGSGLGLSTVYGIIKQSGGNIWVYSEPGKGTTFKIYLPQVDEPAEIIEAQPEPGEVRCGTETILVVEDEAGVRELAARALQLHGYTVLEARDGHEAIAACDEHSEPIQLMLTDVVMPEMSGPELAARLGPLYPEMKVLYMSGYTDEGIVQNGILQPDAAFLEKPFDPEGLARKVREVLESE